MKLKIIIKGTPPTVNTIWRKGRNGTTYLTEQARRFKAKVQAQIPRMERVTGDCKVRVDVQFPTRRRCDLDNYLKIVMDAMNGFVYLDDSQINEIHATKSYSKNEPFTRIIVEW